MFKGGFGSCNTAATGSLIYDRVLSIFIIHIIQQDSSIQGIVGIRTRLGLPLDRSYNYTLADLDDAARPVTRGHYSGCANNMARKSSQKIIR